MADRLRIDIIQDGIVVASVTGQTFSRVLHEAAIYAAKYQDDGPIEVKAKVIKGKEKRHG